MNRKVWLLLFAVTGFLLTKQPVWAQIDKQASPAASYSKQEDGSNLLNQIKTERLNRFSHSHNPMSQITGERVSVLTIK